MSTVTVEQAKGLVSDAVSKCVEGGGRHTTEYVALVMTLEELDTVSDMSELSEESVYNIGLLSE